ncbi:hypothetical protein [Lysinibacillus sp. FSL P4-0201]
MLMWKFRKRKKSEDGITKLFLNELLKANIRKEMKIVRVRKT